jgi:hypothetical protein
MVQVAHGAEEECCSDDEMVFEAYVSPSDAVEDQDYIPLDDEDMKVSIPVYMVPMPSFLIIISLVVWKTIKWKQLKNFTCCDVCYRARGNLRRTQSVC